MYAVGVQVKITNRLGKSGMPEKDSIEFNISVRSRSIYGFVAGCMCCSHRHLSWRIAKPWLHV